MSHGKCLFVVRCEGEAALAAACARTDALARFYAPLGDRRVTLQAAPPGHLVGTVGAASASADGLHVWGEPLPPPLGSAAALVDASDHELRRIEGVTSAIAVAGERVRMVAAPSGPAGLYHCSGRDCEAWSTHATAAGLLAGETAVDPGALGELSEFEYVGGERTLLRAVTALPAAMCVESGPAGARTRCYWPPGERWRTPDGDPAEAAAAELTTSLKRRASSLAPVQLALTGGADSRVAAVAMDEAGVQTEAFTWGLEDWPDVVGARAVAAGLDMRHRLQAVRWSADTDALTALDRLARWTDGVLGMALAERTWPANTRAVVSGMGGETGRAFYYRGLNPAAGAEPDIHELKRQLSPPGAGGGALRWLDAAVESGHEGWRLLDVIYADQRVRRWGRAQLPPDDLAFLPAFTPPRLAAALLALPLADKLDDGFARGFVAARRPTLALASTPPARTRLRDRVLRRPRPARRPAEQASAAGFLAERPGARAYVLETLEWPPLLEGLGAQWAERLRTGVAAGDAAASGAAMRLCGARALDDALRGLRLPS